MKKLDFNEMEMVNGGNLAACAAGPAVLAIGVTFTILSGGTFGFAAVLAMGYTAAMCASAAAEVGR